MTGALAALLDAAGAAAPVAFIVFLRVGAVMALVPAFGEMVVPARVRLVLALAFTAVVAPAVAGPVGAVAAWMGDGASPPRGASDAILLLGTEAMTGLAIGIGFRLFVLALMTAGTIIAQATSLAQLFGSAGVEPMPAVGHLLVIAGLALATMNGLHVAVARALIASYAAVPPGGGLAAADLQVWGIAHIARAFALAFRLAAPFLIASLLYNVAMGVINRAMPHLSVAFVGAPPITLGALGLMLLSLPFGLTVWAAALTRFLADPTGMPPP
jgi:flagellar biosynthesis protein FliR